MLDFQHTENAVVELQRDHKLNLQDWSNCQGSYTFLPTNFHDFSMTFVTISMT